MIGPISEGTVAERQYRRLETVPDSLTTSFGVRAVPSAIKPIPNRCHYTCSA